MAALTSPAAAASYAVFYNGGTGYTGNYSGASGPDTVYNDTKGITPINCPTGHSGCGSADILSPTETFSVTGNSITATVNVTGTPANGLPVNQVWDDLQPNYGGLGVGTLPTTGTGSDGDDNINGSNVLTLTFATPVTLKGVATLFDSGHSPFGTGNQLTGDFLLSVNGGTFNMVTFAIANDEGLNLYGTSFAFEEDSIEYW